MEPRRLRVGIIFGGRSGEHEVSIETARSVLAAIDRTRYEVLPIGVTQEGAWHVIEPPALLDGRAAQGPRLLASADPGQPVLRAQSQATSAPPVPLGKRLRELRLKKGWTQDRLAELLGVKSATVSRWERGERRISADMLPRLASVLGEESNALLAPPNRERLDVVFPLIHGTQGEDGCLQGLLELADVPYVGSSVLGSAVGMDKLVMKAVFVAHGMPVVPYMGVRRADWECEPQQVAVDVSERIGYPCFVKPANLGSSVGISRVADPDALPAAMDCAAEYSARIIVERGLDARELECGVLGNDAPEASTVGEVRIARPFYDYEAKYHDPRTRFAIPANVPETIANDVRRLAVEAFRAIGASGMARVDFFLDRTSGSLYLNEVNTIPGFTAMSAYPRLWEASGVPYQDLIDRLIQLALERHADQARNRTRYEG